MKRVLVSHAGGRIGLGFTRALRAALEPFHLIGVDANPVHVHRAVTDEKYLVPRADQENFLPALRSVIEDTRPDLIWPQHEGEIATLSRVAPLVGARTFLPSPETIALCQDKMGSYRRLHDAGLPVPLSMPMDSEDDLRRAFQELGPSLWLRATHGVAGRGSLPVSDYDTAKKWISFHRGWGRFMAAQRMTERTVTWESIWRDGRLIAAQTKTRLFWEFSNLTPSGVTGIAGAHKFVRDPLVDQIGPTAVKALDATATGIFGVDMVYDREGVPRITEVNAGRFQSGGAIHVPREGFNLP